MSSKTYHIKLNGKVYEVEIEEVKEGQNVAATSTPKEEPQQEVKKGQVLAILEAMKMENEIVAPHDGAVKAISVDKGQNVNPGETLLKMA